MKRLLAGMILALLAGGSQAGPQINVGGLYDYLESGSSTLLKRVRNLGDTTAFVKVSVVELVYDGRGQAREVSHDGLPVAERPLIASPARLIVPANGMQAVRLLYRGERERERYFRLRFVPVLPEHGDGFAISDEEARSYEAELKAGVNILAGYGALLFVRPQETTFRTEINELDSQFHIRNNGSATVVLDHFNDCDRTGSQCAVATKHHIRPGLDRPFRRAPGRVYRFELIEGGERRRVEIKG
ncbi:pilus assembly protein [Pseudomonas japonica]|uniref:P pilus assembly protein, chaperone PapD n=1 Tax=Pseudomonas japonica TaxID=256466 RepID=A0A239I1D8_9PSED|nr:pilus assembly protein [Pseudomonas japonica]SNS87261.1 hypothetical protein SAMN05444352_11753 [Pseudomonas japonica]SNS87387.1 hypothetical protein SAMN05444352_11759 [Pseudomonas japonica]